MFKIGELAREAGVPVTTVRYYERAGLLRASKRSASNYRLYGSRESDRLKFIRAAQAAGFTLADVRVLLRARDSRKATCTSVVAVIEQRLEDVQQRLDALTATRDALVQLRKRCRGAPADSKCPVVAELEGTG